MESEFHTVYTPHTPDLNTTFPIESATRCCNIYLRIAYCDSTSHCFPCSVFYLVLVDATSRGRKPKTRPPPITYTRRIRVNCVPCSISGDMKYVFLFEIDLYEIRDRDEQNHSLAHLPIDTDQINYVYYKNLSQPPLLHSCAHDVVGDW